MSRKCKRAIVAGVVALAAAPAAPAHAGIWTAVDSGTRADIAAIEHHGPGRIWFVTSGGTIHRMAGGAFRLEHAEAGRPFTDIAFKPGGLIGLAATADGRLLRSTDGGDSWSAVGLPTPGAGCGAPAAPVTGIYDVEWAAGRRAYLVAAPDSVMRSTDDGLTWQERNRPAGGGCRIDRQHSQVRYLGGSGEDDRLYLIERGPLGRLAYTANALATAPELRGEMTGGSFGSVHTRLAVDAVNTNRLWSTVDDGWLARSEDGGRTRAMAPVRNAAGEARSDRWGLAAAGGTVLAAGDGGQIEHSIDGVSFFYNDADGALATADWRAVALADADHGAVGGRNGALVLTDRAREVPDVDPPTGRVEGPATVAAGEAATYTAVAEDDRSGVDPASWRWTSAATAPAEGNPVTVAFDRVGTHRLQVAFRDRAGNAATAHLDVRVVAPAAPPAPGGTPVPAGTPAPPPRPALPPSAAPVRLTTTVVAGRVITLRAPARCVARGASFTTTLAVRRARRKGSRFVKVTRVDFYIDRRRVAVDRRPPFVRRLTVRGLRAGSTHVLRARATIKVRRGKAPKRSIRSVLRVCG